MSLYIGKTESQTPIVHITYSNNDPVGSISSDNPIDSTIFHSSLPYVSFKKVYLTTGYTMSWSSYPSVKSFTVKIPAEAIDLINEGYFYDICVSTSFSGNKYFIADNNSYFEYRVGVSPSYSDRFINLKFGPNNNSFTWSSYSFTPSLTNSYVELGDQGNNILGSILYTGRFSGSADYLNPIVYLHFYNIKNNILEKITNTSSIYIDRNKFQITTPYSSINLEDFKPVRLSPSKNENTYSSKYLLGILNISRYVNTNETTKWIIGKDDSSYTISKVFSDESSEALFFKGAGNMLYLGKEDLSFTIGTSSSASTGTLTSLDDDTILIIYFNGTFTNSVTGKIPAQGTVKYVTSINSSSTISYGKTTSVSKGVYYGTYYKLNVNITNGLLSLLLSASKMYSGGTTYGSYAGSIKIFKFKIV